jgi:GSH-dependent disulfide-bond oxidoreductase
VFTLYGGAQLLADEGALTRRVQIQIWKRILVALRAPTGNEVVHAYPLHGGDAERPQGCESRLRSLGPLYQLRASDLEAREQKQEWFLAVNPNRRIPAIVDDEADMADLGPNQGQAYAFVHYLPEHLPGTISWFRTECRRLYEVLDRRLTPRDSLCGDFRIADIATWSWVRLYEWPRIDVSGLDSLMRWNATLECNTGIASSLRARRTHSSASECGGNGVYLQEHCRKIATCLV